MVLGEILRLHQMPSPSSGTAGAVKLKETMNPPVSAQAARHGLIFLYAGLAQFQPKVQQLGDDALRVLCLFLYELLGEAFHRHILIRQPYFQLIDAAWILQSGQFLRPLECLLRKSLIYTHRLFHQQPVHPHAPVIDLLIQCIVRPFLLRQRILLQHLSDGTLGLHILRIVLLVHRPFFRRVAGTVAHAPAVGFGGLAGNGKIADKILAFFHFLFRCAQYDGNVRQSSGQRQGSRHDHRTAPLMRIQPMVEVLGQTYPFELGIVLSYNLSATE